ncbi:MAG TPA: peptidoglycan editing factor PgeF [Candidatus Acidoferrum sp.]
MLHPELPLRSRFDLATLCDYTVQIVITANSSRRSRHRRKQPNLAKPPKLAAISSPWSLDCVQGLKVLRLTPFKKFPWLVHGFSTRFGGASSLEDEKVLNLAFMDWDERKNVLENRKRFQSAVAAKDFSLVPLEQIHSDLIHSISSVPADPSHGDGSITNNPNLLLSVQTADCVPILLVDPKKRAVAAIHAGWRGTLARIVEKSVGRMQQEYGSKPSDLLAAIGPSIGPCCYEVGVELVTKFTAQFADASEYFDEPRTGDEPNPIQWLNMKPPGHQPPPKNVHLDLRKANVSQLKSVGVRAANIYVSDLCTACNTNMLFSYRREGPLSGRLMAVIGIHE